MEKVLTVREVRKILFDSNKYIVIGSEELTNKAGRDYLYALDNQDENVNTIDNGDHLLVWF